MILLEPFNKDLTVTKGSFVYMTGQQVVGSSLQNFQQEIPLLTFPGYSRGFKNPDWKNKVARKEDATSPMEVRVDEVKYHNVFDVYEYKWKNFGLPTESYKLTAIPPPSTSGIPNSINSSWSAVQEARNIALAYKRKYVDDVVRPFQSQVFLGEIKETLEFLRHPFQKMLNLADSAKMARYNAAVKYYRQAAIKHRSGVFSRTNEARLLLNDIADAWFEVRFALVPLVNDVASAFALTQGRSVKRRSSFRGDSKQTLPQQRVDWNYARFFNGYRVMNDEVKASYFINTGIIFDDVSKPTNLAKYFSDTTQKLVEWIPTIYELVPGSWFLDYFVNVGDILNSIAVSSKVSLAYDCRTTVVEYKRIVRWEPNFTPDARRSILRVGTGLAHATLTRRYISRVKGGDDFPVVTFSLPSEHGNMYISLTNTALYLSRKFANVFGR